MKSPVRKLRTLKPVPRESSLVDTTPTLTPGAGHVVAVTSGKGGVGKSNISVNLGIILSQLGQRVCLLDADMNLANINILLGLNPALTLNDFLDQKLNINELLIPGPEGIDIIPGANGIADFVELDQDKQKHLLKAVSSLENKYDYLIVDTAAGVDDTVINFLLAAPSVVVTITSEPTSLTDAFRLLKELKARGFSRMAYVVVNMVSGRVRAGDAYRRFSGAVAKYLDIKLRYLGYVPNDHNVAISVCKQQAVTQRYPEARASRSLMDIARRLVENLDNKNDPARAVFSSYFDSLSNMDHASDEGEINSSPEAAAETEKTWVMKKAMDFLLGITPDEAVELMADAIVNCDIKTADETMELHESLLRYAIKTDQVNS